MFTYIDMSYSLNKLNIIVPLNLFNSEYIFLKNKYINIKYILLKNPNFSFNKSIKYINNIYYTTLQLFKRIKKSNIINRNNLSRSTRKPFQQKGLGKARSGSFKSPLWRGGSILFGPTSRKLLVRLQTKKKKISILYILLNKRTYISFLFLFPIFHTYNNITEHLIKQKRIKGLFSTKVIYISFNNLKNIANNNNSRNYINSLNLLLFIKFDYIIFLI